VRDEDDGGGSALFQIAEPGLPATRPRRPGRGIGIDLGTTHSLVAVAPDGAVPRALADLRGESLLPSVVSYGEMPPRVGRAARERQVLDPTRVIASAKRFIGRAAAEIDFRHPYEIVDDQGVLRFDLGDRRPSPVEVSAEILAVLAARARAEIGDIDGAVITVPAYFDEAQRQATKDAGRIAGLHVYRLLAEPTAAALAYGLDRGGRGTFAVYDLGGGTFDVSILRLRDGVFQVLAIGGDSALGGDDFDRALASRLLARSGVGEATPAQLQEALTASRALKERLSEDTRATTRLDSCGGAEHEVARAELEELVEPLLRRTARACRATLADAGVEADELSGVVLVGGSTRMPLVRRLVAQTFGREPLSDIDPDRVVAYGAAIQADLLSGGRREGVTLLDVVPLSLGLETMGGIVERIIPRNATVPIGARQVFTNYSEQQTGMTIHVVQGERELAADCRSLARFELRGLPRLPPSMARIEVTFQLDADALLTVGARELMTGVRQTVEVRATHGLSPAEIDRLVLDSLDHAREDFAARDRVEARVELGRVVLAVRAALREVGDRVGLVSAAERAVIDEALGEADRAMADADTAADRLRHVREQLEQWSEPVARRRMERALAAGIGGKSLAEVEGLLADEERLAARRGAHAAQRVEEEGG
jgi:molecular chaperone HscA